MKDIIIITAGGFGREVHYLIDEINKGVTNEWNVQGFVDDDKNLIGKTINGLPVLGTIDSLQEMDRETAVVIAVGKSAIRKKLVQEINSNENLYFPNLIHPDVTLMPSNILGNGNIICKGSILTVNIVFGNFNIVNLNCTVGHDVQIGSFCTLAPNINLSGYSRIEDSVELGTNVIVIPGVSIGEHSVVGAGAVVTKDIQAYILSVGMPATELKKLR